MLEAFFWWTGLAVWCVIGLAGLLVTFVFLMDYADAWWAGRLRRAGKLAYTMIIINTWTRTKQGREVHQAAKEAIQRFRDELREEEETTP